MSEELADVCWQRRERVREALGATPAAYTREALQRLADGPIMDPLRSYTPAGVLSWSECRAREVKILRGE